MIKNTGLVFLLFLLFSCQQTTKKTKGSIDFHNDSPGMNGGVFTPKKSTASSNFENLKNEESPTTAGYAWLMNHQEEDGHWDTNKWEGSGTAEINIATTGMVLLAFLSGGYTDYTSRWKINVGKSIAWLIKTQKPDGSFAQNNFVNGICTMALAEATGMGCKTEGLKNATNTAVDYLLKQQNPSGGFWYHGPKDIGKPSEFDDMAVTTWCIMGLKSALFAEIKRSEIITAFHLCGNLLDKT